MFENKFEKALWNLRFVVILAVILSIVASITLFVIGSWDILYSVIYQNPLLNAEVNNNNDLLFKIISSIDLFLIGIVLLIFGFGVYELFISEIDFAKGKFSESTLKISSLDQLKNKIIKVIIIVLIVKFFEKVLKLTPNFTTPEDVLFFSVSILSICLGYYLINRK
ncbi:YqhA family protein [Flavobacteriales bacterium]|nr:YqhA family protein [Flavobacteriales bacterium]MDG1189436.1 YqhA family protein [Flavobacteriales bacterium]|tara:strand:+ start:1338 stop:1835 length:498 start_codon:yes stop_codon:yes gene_type:complete